MRHPESHVSSSLESYTCQARIFLASTGRSWRRFKLTMAYKAPDRHCERRAVSSGQRADNIDIRFFITDASTVTAHQDEISRSPECCLRTVALRGSTSGRSFILRVVRLCFFPSTGMYELTFFFSRRKQSIYQVVTDRFARSDLSTSAPCDTSKQVYCGGSWQGLISKLDYIQGMGFTAVWISPIVKQIDGVTKDGYVSPRCSARTAEQHITDTDWTTSIPGLLTMGTGLRIFGP